jgi:DNA-binding MarR family transcriptional regulator
VPGSVSNKQKVDIGVLNTMITYHLRRAQVSAFNNFNDKLMEPHITPGQFGVLSLIASNEGLSQSAVARTLGVERSTMVAVIDGLEKRGLVVRKPSPTDRRSNALELSAEGEKVFETCVNMAQDGDALTTQGLSASETNQLMTLLRKMNSANGV